MASPRWSDWVRQRLDAPDDVVEEIAHQLEDVFEDALARGLSEGDAREEAGRQVPDWDALARSVVRARSVPNSENTRASALLSSGVWQDIRYGVRALFANPGYTLLATTALALGIGANTVAFTFVHSLLLKPLSVHAPEELVRIYGSLPESFDYATLSFPDYDEIRQRRDLFSAVAVDKLVPLSLGTTGNNERIWGFMVSGRYFSMLGVRPLIGRVFDYEDNGAEGKHRGVVLGFGFWQRAFGGRTSVLSETITINGQPFDVVGVLAEDFTGTNVGVTPALWLPAAMSDVIMPGFELRERSNRSFLSVARLRPGIDLETARAGLEVLARRLQTEHPDSNRGVGFAVLPETEGGVHPILRGGVVGFASALLVVVALVLLLACANVAGLLLSRAAYRRREIALRLALGASRGRLVRQLLVESLVLAVVAGGIGLVLAAWAASALNGLGPPLDIPLSIPMTLDGRVVALAFLLMLSTGILFGLAPALSASKTNLVSSLKVSGSTFASHRSRLRSVLVAGQFALSTVLLVGAVVFLHGLQTARGADVGFNPASLVLASVDLGLQGYDEQQANEFIEELERRLLNLPEVRSSAWADILPFDIDFSQHSVAPEGFEPRTDQGTPSINRAIVSHDYFEVMEIPMVHGRSFTANDDERAPGVVIVNETLAARFWPGEKAIGKRMGRPGGTMMEVVGVARDGKYLTLNEAPTPLFFYPRKQRPSLEMTLIVRAWRDPLALVEPIRDEARALDPGLPVYDVKPMSAHLGIALVPARVGASVLGVLASLALALAAVGIHGTLAFAVAQRNFEIGVRRALGAGRLDILLAVVRHALALAGWGLAVGLSLSVVMGRGMASLLFGVQPIEPVAMAVAVAVLIIVALLSSLVPARRAIRVDPITALRAD